MWETAHRSLGTQQLHSSEAQIEMLFWLIDSRGRLLTCKRKQENEPALLLTSDLSKSFPDEFVTETVLLWILWEGFQSEQRFNGSPEDPHRCEAAYLQNMQEVSPKSLERSEPRENLHVGETTSGKKIWRGSASWRHSRGEAVFLLTVRETVHSERQLEGPHEDSHGQEAVSCGMCGKVSEAAATCRSTREPQSGERGSFQAGRHRAETSNHRWWRNHLWLKCPSPRVRALLEELWMHQPRVWTGY